MSSRFLAACLLSRRLSTLLPLLSCAASWVVPQVSRLVSEKAAQEKEASGLRDVIESKETALKQTEATLRGMCVCDQCAVCSGRELPYPSRTRQCVQSKS